MSDDKSDLLLEIERLKGEIAILEKFNDDSVCWFAEEMFFWRTKYLLDHPELANECYVATARSEENIDPMIFI